MKTFKQFLNEAKLKPEHEKEMLDWGDRHYQGVAPDLHQAVDDSKRWDHGASHYHAAVDHLRDALHDQFAKKHPKLVGHFDRIAKKVIKPYGIDDRKEARRAERKQQRAQERASRPPKPKKEPKAKPVKIKARRGIGSY